MSARPRQRHPFTDPERIWIWLLVVALGIFIGYVLVRYAGDLGLDQLFGK